MSLDRLGVGWAFGQVVKKARKAAGLTQPELAPLAGITWHGLSVIERGRRAPSIAVVFGIAKALRMKPDELVRQAQRLVAKYPHRRVHWWDEHKEA